MAQVIQGSRSGRRFDDERYGTVWELVAPAAQPVERYGFAFVEMKAGAESPLHYHRRTEELYYVTNGGGIVTLDGSEQEVTVGDTVVIPPGVRHKIRTGPDGLEFVCVTAPSYDWNDDIEVDESVVVKDNEC